MSQRIVLVMRPSSGVGRHGLAQRQEVDEHDHRARRRSTAA
jgi:hypothetical protein